LPRLFAGLLRVEGFSRLAERDPSDQARVRRFLATTISIQKEIVMARKKRSMVDLTFETPGDRKLVSISTPSGEIIHVPRSLLARPVGASVSLRGDRPLVYCGDGTPYVTQQDRYLPTTEEVGFAELEDGSLVELVRDPHRLERTAFAVWRNRKLKITDHIKHLGRILIPPRKHDHIWRYVVLPYGVAPYNTAQDLARRIRNGIRACVNIPNPYPSLLAAFSVYTWIADLLPTAVYLLISGLPESGKTTLVDTLRLFCRRSLCVADISSAAFQQACSLISPTLMMDETEIGHGTAGREARRYLRGGSSRGHVFLRRDFGGEVFGPKIICCENPPDDPALISKSIIIPMTEQDTSELKKPSDPEMVQLSREIQAQSLQFRLEKYRSIRLASVPGAERLNPRERDLLTAVAAPFAEDPHWCDLLLQSFENSGQLMKRTLPPDEAAVLDGLYAESHRSGGYRQMTVGDLAKSIFEIYKTAGQTMRLEPRAVGAILEKFGIRRNRVNSGYMFWIHRNTRDRIHELVKKFGFNLPLKSLELHPSITCEDCERLWATHDLPTDDEELELETK
jgi:hypothetical protein